MANNQISINCHGKMISAELFPAKVPGGAAVVVACGTDGMKEPWAAMIREYAAGLAALGFTALIPNYFEITGTAPGMQVWSSPPAYLDKWAGVLTDTIAYARALPGSPVTRVGLLGFSLGGHLCLRLRGSAKCVVEFFAPELLPLGGLPSSTVKANVQIHHGLADQLVPFREAEAISAVLKKEGATAELFSYEGAGHGFAGADPNNATARRSSKDRAFAFLQKSL